jgi:hypothetical protein
MFSFDNSSFSSLNPKPQTVNPLSERNVRIAPASIKSSVEYLMTVYSRNPRVHIYERGAASIQANYDPHTKLSSQVSYAPYDLISYSLGHKFFQGDKPRNYSGIANH